jgi:hypothetical protein
MSPFTGTMLTYQKNLQVGGSGAAPFGVGIARKLLVKVQPHWHLHPFLCCCVRPAQAALARSNVQDMRDVIHVLQAKQAIGLEQCKFFLTGAAPISTQTLEYFASIGISINEVPACKRVLSSQTCA